MKQQQQERIVAEKEEEFSEEESEYSSEDEDAFLLTDKIQEKLLDTVAKIRNKDPSIYQVINPIFNQEDFQQQNGDQRNKKKNANEKKFTYKDLVKQAHQSSESQQKDEEQSLPPIMQQKKAKNKFKEALNKQKNIIQNQQQEDDLFTVKTKLKKQAKLRNQESNQVDSKKNSTKKLIQKVWSNSVKMDETDIFLRDYILNKRWLSKHISGQNLANQSNQIDEEDQDRSIQMDEYEAKYNFRFQEPDGDKIVQYPRKIEQSMRIKPESRKEKRTKVEQRKKVEEKRIRQEAQRKKQELKQNILAKLHEKQHQQQNFDQGLPMEDQQGFDHDWFFCDDCGKAFQEQETNYQCGQCEDYMLCQDCYDLIIHKHPLYKSLVPMGFGAPKQSVSAKVLEKLQPCKTCRRKIPQTLKHYSYQDRAKNVTLLCERCYDESPLDVKKKFSQVEAKINSNNIQEILQKDPQKVKELTSSKQIEEMVDEYLKYEFQDVIGGGFKTKFKYVNVKPESFGLSDEQILFGDDKQLNKYVSIKKLVPYREDKMKLRNNIYKKKVKTINKSVSENKKLLEQDGIEKRLKKSRLLDKMKRRSEVMKKKRQTRLKILNISNPDKEKKVFVPSSRLASYGVTLENKQQTNQLKK